MRKPSSDGICDPRSAIESLGAERFRSKVSVDPDKTDQNPEDFHDERGKIEIYDERKDDQTGAYCITERICQPIATEFIQLQHQVCDHQYYNADIADEIEQAVTHTDPPNLNR